MKLATVEARGEVRVGLVDDTAKTIRLLGEDLGAASEDMVELIRSYGQLSMLITKGREVLSLADVRLLAPLPRPPRNVICVGKNYRAHAEEFTRSGFDAGAKASEAVPEYPIIFTKPPECVVATGEDVFYPHGVSDSVDYEAELAVVIGKGGSGIKREEALSHVFGYTCVNDVTARDLQNRHKQWFLGKGLDTFCPMGPWIVTADAVDAANLRVTCRINGETRQDANTRDLIFDIPTLIETLSAGMTLYPGDVIATGTPAGVGIGFTPPRFLKPGDRMEVEIEGIGVLSNKVA